MISVAELEKKAVEKFGAAGLLPYFWSERSQFLDFPQGFFVEIVSRAGNKLGEFAAAINELQKETGEKIDPIVRAAWEVFSVDDPAVAYSSQGTPRTAMQFPAVLKAGEAKLPVAVDVSHRAQERLKELGRGDRKSLKGMVRDYLRSQLSKGGASYWDPVRFPCLEINEAAVSYLLMHGIVDAVKNKAVI